MTTPPQTINGTLTLQGTAVPAAEVLLFGPGERPAPLLGTAVTDAAGAFVLDGGADVAVPGTVLAKLQGSVVGVAAREASAGAPLMLDVEGPAWTVTVTLEPGVDVPEGLTLALEPDAPARVPERLWPFVAQRAPGVFDAHFTTLPMTSPSLSVSVLSGAWRVAGSRILDGPLAVDAPPNLIVAAARDEAGAPLPGSASHGFAFELGRDRHLTLVLGDAPQ